MGYTNSSLVAYQRLSPNHSGQRTHTIDRITPHCVVGQCSVETIGEIFAQRGAGASSNYGIGRDGRIGLFVEECNRSWCSSSRANDHRAVTIECASDATAPHAFRDVVYERLVELCVDICRRNGKRRLLWIEDKAAALAYEPGEDEMLLTVHRWFANKACPGDWLMERMTELAERVTAGLHGSLTSETGGDLSAAGGDSGASSDMGDADIGDHIPFKIGVTIKNLNVRKGPGIGYAFVKTMPVGVYTIVEVRDGKGSESGWGRLKSGVGWISLDYVNRV